MWRGTPFTVEQPSYVSYNVTPVDDALLEICLVDITDGPVPTTGRPASAIGCHTSVATEGAVSVVPAGRYSLAIGCLNLETVCAADIGLSVAELGDGPRPPGTA